MKPRGAMTGQWWWSNLSHESPSIAFVHAVGKEGLTHRQTLNSGQLKKKVMCISRSEGGRAAHEEEGSYGIVDSVNCELATCTPADWVRLFETRFSLSVEHLRQRFPQGTGSLLSLLARVPSGVLASLALCLASDFVRDRPLSLESTPSRIGCSARFLSSSGLGLGQLLAVRKPRWLGPPPSTIVLLLFLRLLSLASFQNV